MTMPQLLNKTGGPDNVTWLDGPLYVNLYDSVHPHVPVRRCGLISNGVRGVCVGGGGGAGGLG
jgi:hypothetical protein